MVPSSNCIKILESATNECITATDEEVVQR
jgi:hypothetical protein